MKKCNAYEDNVHRGLCKCEEEIEVRTLEVTDKLVEDAAIDMYAADEFITRREAKRKDKFWCQNSAMLDQYLNHAGFIIDWTLRALKVPHEDSDDVKVGNLLRTLRENGWRLNAHYEYPSGGSLRSYWLFTSEHRKAEGSGRTDLEALEKVVKDTGM